MSRFRSAWDSLVAWPHLPRLLEALLLLLVLAEFVRVVARLISLDQSLQWDEAVYAVRARTWVDPDVPLSGWSYIRPPLLPLVATVPVLAGGDEAQLRAVGLAIGVALVLCAWWLARSIAGPLAGLVAAAVVATGPAVQRWSATLLTDLPAAALLIAVAIMLWRELELRPRPGAGLVIAAGLAGLAFGMRYGSIVALAPMLVLAAVLWWRRLAAAPRVTAAAVGLGIVIALGHLAWSMLQTGLPLGILFAAQNVVSVDPAGDVPIDEYLRYVDFALAGDAGQVALVAGVAALPIALIASMFWTRWSRPARAMAFLVPSALIHVALLTSGVAHAEERFFVFSTTLLIVCGVSATVLIVRPLPWPAVGAMLVVAAYGIVIARAPAVDYAFDWTLRTGAYYERFRTAGEAMREIAVDDCGIITGADPIVAWYSGCATDRLRLPAPGGSVADVLDADERWLVLYGGYADIDFDASPTREAIGEVSGPPLRITDPVTGDVIAWAWRFADR